jgi:hypothetical protein
VLRGYLSITFFDSFIDGILFLLARLLNLSFLIESWGMGRVSTTFSLRPFLSSASKPTLHIPGILRSQRPARFLPSPPSSPHILPAPCRAGPRLNPPPHPHRPPQRGIPVSRCPASSASSSQSALMGRGLLLIPRDPRGLPTHAPPPAQPRRRTGQALPGQRCIAPGARGPPAVGLAVVARPGGRRSTVAGPRAGRSAPHLARGSLPPPRPNPP